MKKDEKELNGKKVLSAIENIDSDLITEAQPVKEPSAKIITMVPKKNKNLYLAGIGVAACALIAGGIGAGIFFGNSPQKDPGTNLAQGDPTSEETSEKQEGSTDTTVTNPESLLGKNDPEESSEFMTEDPASTPTELALATPSPAPSLPDELKPSEYDPSDLLAEESRRTDAEFNSHLHGEDPLTEPIADVKEGAPSGDIGGEPVPDGVPVPDGDLSHLIGPEVDDPGYISDPGIEDPGHITDPGIEEPGDKFGILTAGRWNDNANWGFFKNLVSTDLISFPAYGLNPVFRSAVTVKNEADAVRPGLKVEAFYTDDETVIWTGMTNEEGCAYLFLPESETRTWNVRVYDTNGTKIYTGSDAYALPGKVEEGVPDSQKRTKDYPETIDLTIEAAEKIYTNTQVMLILDTTGSMGDELLYLQADFGKIMDRIENPNVTYSWNFYRDQGDDYVTKTNGFSNDREALKKLLNNEVAAGGGDTPEAVADILIETMTSEDWADDSVKIAFLIFDAPPHDETAAEVLAAVATAAEQGIHLIPVVSSNSERETELFGRALAIMTDGEYVFLTDDSGVGESHLEPIIGDYEVQKLGDIIVDIINEYVVGFETIEPPLE